MNHSDMWGPDALARLGITFETGQEACLFADLLHDELERRVEQELLFTVPAEQMWALDNCKDGKEVLCWAEKNCPSYRTILKNAGRQLKREVLANRRKIQGAVVAPWSAVWDRYTEELELSGKYYAALKRAGLNTIGDILAYGNLKWVRCLDRRGMTELTENLCRILPDQLIGEGGAARLQEDMMEAKYGKIVNMSAVFAVRSHPFDEGPNPAYGTSKAAVIGLTTSMAATYAKHGITVNAIAPAHFRTPMTENTFVPEMKPFLDCLTFKTPMGRFGEPGELNGPILFFSSDASSYVTGQLLPVDGGYTTI